MTTARLVAAMVSMFVALSGHDVQSQQAVEGLTRAGQRLAQIEANLKRLESTKEISSPVPPIDTLLDAYAADMRAAFEAANAQLEQYAKSKRKAGSLKPMEEFETVAQQHQQRLNGIWASMGKVQTQISEGQTVVAPSLLNRMSPTQIKEFREEFLSPEGEAVYQRTAPKLWKGAIVPRSAKPAAFSARPCVETLETSWFAGLSRAQPSLAERLLRAFTGQASLLDRLVETMIPSAHAAAPPATDPSGLGAACYSACVGGVGLGCLICVASAPGAVKYAWSQMADCKSHCSRCKYYLGFIPSWGCLCRGTCTAAFIARLA